MDTSKIEKFIFFFVFIVVLLLSIIVICIVDSNSSSVAEMENKLRNIEQYVVLIGAISGSIAVTMLVVARNRENK